MATVTLKKIGRADLDTLGFTPRQMQRLLFLRWMVAMGRIAG